MPPQKLLLASSLALAATALAAHADPCNGPATPFIALGNATPSTGVGTTNISATDAFAAASQPVFNSLGRVYIYARAGSDWSLETTVVSTSSLGTALGLDATTLAATCPLFTPRVDIFDRVISPAGPAWTLTQSLPAPSGSYFGRSVSLHGDTLAVGADGAGTNPGSVVIYQRTGSTWVLVQTIPDPNPSTDHFFAFSVALAGDTLIVGTIGDDTDGPNAGAAHIYRRAANTWTLSSTLRPGPTNAHDHFGASVVLDGTRLAVTSSHYSHLANEPGSPGDLYNGYVQIYDLDAQGVFQPTARLVHPTHPFSAIDCFANSIALRGDRLVVGAYLEDAGALDAGAAHVFQLMPSGWTYRGPVTMASPAVEFGYGVAISGVDVLAAAPGLSHGTVGLVAFGPCAQPPAPGETPRCIPTVTGLFAFINAWFHGEPFADFNQNGALDVNDIFDFLNAWLAGCP